MSFASLRLEGCNKFKRGRVSGISEERGQLKEEDDMEILENCAAPSALANAGNFRS
jgi:hypothetical protein